MIRGDVNTRFFALKWPSTISISFLIERDDFEKLFISFFCSKSHKSYIVSGCHNLSPSICRVWTMNMHYTVKPFLSPDWRIGTRIETFWSFHLFAHQLSFIIHNFGLLFSFNIYKIQLSYLVCVFHKIRTVHLIKIGNIVTLTFLAQMTEVGMGGLVFH